MVLLVAIFIFLFHHGFCIDYFDQSSIGSRQRIPSGSAGIIDQQRQQPHNPFLQTQNAPQQPKFGGNPYQRSGQTNGQQSVDIGNSFGSNVGQPRQQQSGTSFGNALNGQRQNEQYEFGRGLQLQQQKNSSQPFGSNPSSNQDYSSGGSFGNPNFHYPADGNVLVEV